MEKKVPEPNQERQYAVEAPFRLLANKRYFSIHNLFTIMLLFAMYSLVFGNFNCILLFSYIMNLRWSIVESELRRRAVLTASELKAAVKTSQPTLSRLLARSGGQRILRLGRGRSTRYAMVRNVAGLGCAWPLYVISPTGEARLAGRLYALEAGSWCVQQEIPWDAMRGDEFVDGLYPGVPWFLDDLRPQGFLGRCFARTYSQSLGLPRDPGLWRADDVVTALLRQGQDLQGSFVLGETMLAVVQGRSLTDPTATPATTLSKFYPARAEAALGGEWPGSSAAGEQPKFTACLADADGTIRHAIVKFTGRAGRPEDRRWADLLIAEHVASSVVSRHGLPSASTRLIEAGERLFLESERFDRVGPHGRRGLVSLAALDSAFFCQLDTPWTAAANRLLANGWISAEDADRLSVLWWFGVLIGNTDMHYGNVSLFMDHDRPLSLAPSYDMLPMLYRPDVEGGLPERRFAPQPPPPESIAACSRAVAMAATFWSELANTASVSAPFRTIAEQNAGVVSRYRDRFVASRH